MYFWYIPTIFKSIPFLALYRNFDRSNRDCPATQLSPIPTPRIEIQISPNYCGTINFWEQISPIESWLRWVQIQRMQPIFRFWGHHRNWSLHFVPMHAEVSTSAVTHLLALGWSLTDNFYSNNHDGHWLYIYRRRQSSRLRIMAHRKISTCTNSWSKGKVPSRRFLYFTIDSCDEKVRFGSNIIQLMIAFVIIAIFFNSSHFYQTYCKYCENLCFQWNTESCNSFLVGECLISGWAGHSSIQDRRIRWAPRRFPSPV